MWGGGNKNKKKEEQVVKLGKVPPLKQGPKLKKDHISGDGACKVRSLEDPYVAPGRNNEGSDCLGRGSRWA